MTVPKQQHLQKRGSVWYFRRRVPVELLPIVGKQWVYESLKTKDLKVAQKRRNIRLVELDAEWAELQSLADQGGTESKSQEVASLSQYQVLERVRDYVVKIDAKWRDQYADVSSWTPTQLAESKADLSLSLEAVSDPTHPEFNQEISGGFDSVFGKGGHTKMAGDQFASIMMRGLREVYRRGLARIDGDYSELTFDNDFSAAKPAGASLGNCVTSYVEAYSKKAAAEGISKKRVDAVQAATSLLLGFVDPATPVSKFTHGNAISLRDELARYPKNCRQFYPNKTVQEAIESGEAEGKASISSSRQKDIWRDWNAVFELARQQSHISSNPLQGVSPFTKPTSTGGERIPFTTDMLAKLFQAPLYTGSKDDGQGYNKIGPHIMRRGRFWVPLIALFTGMRLNEICQLYVKDIQTGPSEICFIDVSTDGEGKTLKTAASKRRVPIHDELIRIGLMAYVAKPKKAGDTRLFPELKADKYGNRGASFSKWFDRGFLRHTLGSPSGIVFHSFRHGFRDALRAADVPEPIQDQLGGWAGAKTVGQSYGQGYDIDKLNTHLQKIAYTGLDLSHLYEKG
jgi:integrase